MPWSICVPVTARLSKRFHDVLGEDVEAKLEQRLAELRTELRQEMADLRAELREQIAGLRAEIRTGLQEVRTEAHQGHTALERVRAELLRWMFGFWVTTFIGVAGLLIVLSNR
jgi:hypothetical protein